MNDKDYIITLEDNKEYALIDTIELDDCKYVYLVELDNPTNYIVAEFLGGSIRAIEDKDCLGKVMFEFARKQEESNGTENN